MTQTRYYHASPRRFAPGAYLNPALQKTGADMGGVGVYLTTSAVPHFTIVERAVQEGWYVYEVRPLGNVRMGAYDDLVCAKGALVVKRVGHAQGLTPRQADGALRGSKVAARLRIGPRFPRRIAKI